MLLLNLLQAQPRISAFVIVAAALVLIGGVALFVYFYKRYKRIEKEPEEDWDLSRRSLFVNVPPRAAVVEESSAAASAEVETPATEAAPVQIGATREFASDIDLSSFAPAAPSAEPELRDEVATMEAKPEKSPAPQPRVLDELAASEGHAKPEEAPPPEPRATEILASPSVPAPVAETEPETEAAPFDEEVWTGLEIAEQPRGPEPAAHAESPRPEPLSVARLEQRPPREPFEPPRIERISHREAFEPPTIEPLAPRDAAATRELRSAQEPGIEQKGGAEDRMARGTVRFGSAAEAIPSPPAPSRPERETRELWGSMVAAAPVAAPDRSIGASGTPRPRSFGSILGLPADYSHQPLILGEPVRPADEMGIEALTNYGKDLGPKGGRAGTIALLTVIVLLVGAIGLYFLVPSVHSRVGAFVARLRGTDAQALEAARKPRAQVIPSTRPEVTKNMVTARGAVINVSDEPLENLTVEVSLQRGGDAPPETRTVPVSPNLLAPTERGTFEFEYDGKRDTGFAGYTITRLLSNGAEVRFSAPGQK